MSQGYASFTVLSTDVVGTVYTIAHGLSLPPQIVMAWLNGQASTGAPVVQTYQKSFGCAVKPKGASAITQICSGAHSDNAQAQTQSDVTFRNDCIGTELAPGLNDTVTSGKLSLTAIDGTNLTFTLTEQFTQSTLVKLWFVAGNDLTWIDLRIVQAPTVSGPHSHTGLGFKPDFLMCFGDHLSQAIPFVQPDSGTHFGVCDKLLHQWALAGGENTNGGGGVGGSGRATSFFFSGDFINIPSNNMAGLNTEGFVTSLDSDGFTVDYTITLDPGQTTGRQYAVLSVQGANWQVGLLTTFNDILTHDVSTAVLGVDPEAVVFASVNQPDSSFAVANEALSFGLVSGATNSVSFIGQKGLPWTPSTVVYTDQDATKVYLHLDTTGARIRTATAVLGTAKFTWQQSSADAGANAVGWFAYGTQPPAGILTTVVKTVKPAGGGDYTNLDTALANELANHKNMITQNIILEFDCYAGLDSLNVSHLKSWNNPGGAGYMTSAANYILIKAIDGHAGKIVADGTKYLLDLTNTAGSQGLLIQNEFVRFQQLQIRLTTTDASNVAGYFCASTGMIGPTHWEFINCIGQAIINGTPGGGDMFHPPSAAFNDVGITWIAANCIAYDVLFRDVSMTGFNAAANALNQTIIRYNCTAVNCNQGFQDRPNVIDKNNVAIGCDNGWNTGAGAPNAASDFNFSTCGPSGVSGGYYPGTSSTSALDAKGANSANGLPVAMVDPVNGDYRPLQGVDTNLIGTGTDLHADATYPFNFDVANVTRTALWTRGAWHEPVVATTQTWKWSWTGAVMSSSARVICRYNVAEQINLNYSTDPTFVSGVTTLNANADSNGFATFSLVGLSPNTVYYYRTAANSAPATFSPTYSFKSLPLENNPASFSMTIGGCSDTGSNTNLYNKIASLSPLMHINFGDLHYWNIVNNDQALYRLAFDTVFTSPKRNKMWRTVPSDYAWDDHDFGKDNADGTNPTKGAAQAAFREAVPSYTLPATVSANNPPPPPWTFDYYVSTTGGGAGHAGTINDPFSLSFALSGAGGLITAGKKVGIRGGVYDAGAGSWTLSISGNVGTGVDNSDNKIIFWAYPGEFPILRNSSGGAADVFKFQGNYVWIGRVEIMDNGWASRNVATQTNGCVTVGNGSGNGGKLIYCVLHDGEQNFQNIVGAMNSDKFEMYGCVSHTAGVDVAPLGHNFYSHHTGSTSARLVVDSNIVYNSFGLLGQFYANSDHVDWIDILNNIWFGGGALSASDSYGSQMVLIGGQAQPPTNCRYLNNMLFCEHTADRNAVTLEIGFAAGNILNVEVGNNYHVGGGNGDGSFKFNRPVVPQNSLNVHDNFSWIWDSSHRVFAFGEAFPVGYTWTNNTWVHEPTAGWAGTSFATWKTNSTLGSTDTQTDVQPSVTKVFVIPTKKYEQGRGHVCYFNWAGLANVPVDLSTILNVNDAYAVYDVRDLTTPVLTGVYAGGTVNFPTTQKPDPTPIGGSLHAPDATAPFFNAFVVQQQASTVVSGAVYHSFVVGRCRFVVTDLRSERSPNANIDDSSKTMMGLAQKTWFENEISLAKSNGQLVFWLSTVPWIAPAGDNNNDDWGGFLTEKTELINFIASKGMQQQVIICCGDMHSAAIDNGTNGNGFVVFLPFPENQTTQIYGGGYTQGPITHAATRLMGFAGLIEVTDTGGPTANVKLSVFNELGTQMSYQQNFTIQPPLSGKIFITHVIDVLDLTAFPERPKSFNA